LNIEVNDMANFILWVVTTSYQKVRYHICF
jgi:hypothetical protein